VLHHPAVLAGHLYEQAPLGDCVAQWLLNVHVLASDNGVCRYRDVPVVRCGNSDYIDGFIFEHPAKIFVAVNPCIAIFEFLHSLGQLSAVDVAQGYKPHTIKVMEFTR
jgi:hypothetical protein